MCSSSDIGVDRLGVFVDLVPKLVDRFEGGFATNGSEGSFLKEGVLIIHRARHDG